MCANAQDFQDLISRQTHASDELLSPHNHSHIKSWAAIGDSYASGLGTGQRVDYGCSRYAGAYPNLMNNDERLGSNQTRRFQSLAGSGLKATQILQKQVPHLKGKLDMITVSAGGNDVGLGEILDSCIFQWKHGDSAGCEAAMERSQLLIDTVLTPSIDALLQALAPKLAPHGRIYYPGYAQFFGESTSCNNVSWSVWQNMPSTARQNLTRERRIRMNDMVAQVNKKLQIAAANAGPHVSFINWDWTFTQARGRFCEEGFTEPAPDRKGLLFFEWNTLDDGDDPDLVTRPGDPVPVESFEGSIGKWIVKTLNDHPSAEFRPAGSQIYDIRKNMIGRMAAQKRVRAQLGFEDAVFWFLPDSWKRVFHPRALGHRLIADMILHEMAVQRARTLGVKLREYKSTATANKLEL